MRRLKLLVLYVSKHIGLFALSNWWTRDKLKILCYHGFAFADEAQFRPKLFITPTTFARRLDTLKRYGHHVIGLDEAVDALYAKRLPQHALVITVDDGFHSFHQLALPLLRARLLPATVYVTSYYVRHAVPVFRLVVQYMFWKSAATRLSLRGRAWHTDGEIDLRDASQRGAAVDSCVAYGEAAGTEEERVAICRTLGEMLGVPYAGIVERRLLHLMTPAELASLHDAGVNVQLHTHRHSFPDNDETLAVREIEQNRAALSGWVAGPFNHFCYPSGVWDERQWSWLEQLGVKSSTTCVQGLNTATTPRHALRRFLDGENIHPLEFEAALSGFSDLLRPTKFV
jgi:peptidoglycan/xylan/chitin deacetylase (PgdA/CDA1 family)